VGGAVFLDWECLEPVGRTDWSDDGGVEEVALARLSPWHGYEGACSEGSRVRVAGEAIQDLDDDIVRDGGDGGLWDYGDGILRDYRDAGDRGRCLVCVCG